jgi:NitT/TauT family transport system permease protein
MKKIILPVLPLLTLILALEFLVRSKTIPAFIVPAPSSILKAFTTDTQELVDGAFSTAFSALSGLLLSFFFGTLFSIGLSLSKILRQAFYPYAIFFQTVPVISIAPILVIWFGFGRPTVIAAAFIVSIFPIIASTLLGIESTDPNLLDLFDIYSASPLQKLLKLRLLFALPQIFTGLRIAAGLAVIGAIAGEFIGGSGLGSVVDTARTTQRIDIVFAAVLISSLIGLVFVGAINLLSWLSLRRWHVSEI